MAAQKYRKFILILLAFVFLSLISMLFLVVLEKLYNNIYTDIIFKGIKLGMVTTTILYLIHRNLKIKEKNNEKNY